MTLAEAGMPASATGTVTFATGVRRYCTVTLGPATSCPTSATLDPGDLPRDRDLQRRRQPRGVHGDDVSFVVTKVASPFTAAAAPASVGFGNSVTL